MADAKYMNTGGSDFILWATNVETNQKLIDAGYVKENDEAPLGFPIVRFNFPTSTNSSWARKRYRGIMKALEGCELESQWGNDAYTVGSDHIAR